MIKIRFYNSFKNGEISKQVHMAQQLVSDYSEIAGFTVYEKVGNGWLPYLPFNGSTTYVKRLA